MINCNRTPVYKYYTLLESIGTAVNFIKIWLLPLPNRIVNRDHCQDIFVWLKQKSLNL